MDDADNPHFVFKITKIGEDTGRERRRGVLG